MDIKKMTAETAGTPVLLSEPELAVVSGGTEEEKTTYVFKAHEVIYLIPGATIYLLVDEDVCTDDPEYQVRCTRHSDGDGWDIVYKIEYQYESAKRLDFMRSRSK